MSSEHKFTYTSGVPVDVSWKLLKKRDELLPKLLPSVFAKVEVTEGNGGAGTIRVITLGEGAGYGAGLKVKERVDFADEATHTLIYSVLEGGDPRYIGLIFTTHLTAAGNSTTIAWTVAYTPANSDVPAPTQMQDFAEASVKALEGYAKEHPSEFA